MQAMKNILNTTGLRRGFTLIELLIAVAILGVLGVLIVLSVTFLLKYAL